MKKILVLLVFAMMSTMGVMAQNNTVQLPYSANFTQHWTANGATVVDSTTLPDANWQHRGIRPSASNSRHRASM